MIDCKLVIGPNEGLDLTSREPPTIHFERDGIEVGRLWVDENNTLQFSGALSQSAETFFEVFIQPIVDDYFRQKLGVALYGYLFNQDSRSRNICSGDDTEIR